jgi:hypothetical protein
MSAITNDYQRLEAPQSRCNFNWRKAAKITTVVLTVLGDLSFFLGVCCKYLATQEDSNYYYSIYSHDPETADKAVNGMMIAGAPFVLGTIIYTCVHCYKSPQERAL